MWIYILDIVLVRSLFYQLSIKTSSNHTIMVQDAGLEPASSFEREIFLPTTAFAATLRYLWSGLSLRHLSPAV